MASRRNILTGAALMLLEAPAVLASASSPDAELIAACDEHGRLHHILNHRPGDARDCDEMPEWEAYLAACATITTLEPTTLAGMVAKARAAKLEAMQPNGIEESEVAEEWAWSLTTCLAKLAPETAAAT